MSQVIAGLNGVGARYQDSVYLLLDTPAFFDALRNNPALLTRIAVGDVPALAELANLMPDCNAKSDLGRLVTVLSDRDGLLASLARHFVNPDVLHASVRAGALQLSTMLASPEVGLVFDVARALNLRPGSLLREVVEGRIDRNLVERLLSPQRQPRDMLTMLRHVRDMNAMRSIDLPNAGPFLSGMAMRLHEPGIAASLAGIESLSYTRDDDVLIRFNKHMPAVLRHALPPGVRPGDTMTLHVSALNQAGLRAAVHLNVLGTVGEVYKALSFHPTGVSFLDGLLTLIVRLVAGLLFPLVLLVVAIGRPQVRLDWRDNGTRELYLSLYGLNVATVATL